MKFSCRRSAKLEGIGVIRRPAEHSAQSPDRFQSAFKDALWGSCEVNQQMGEKYDKAATPRGTKIDQLNGGHSFANRLQIWLALEEWTLTVLGDSVARR